MKAYDWSKAPEVVDAYLKALETTSPLRLGRTWIEIQMGKAGLVSDWRDFKFGEAHAAWYACLILSRKITVVTARESALSSRPSETAKTIKKLRKGRLRQTVTAAFLETMLSSSKPPPES